MSFINPAREQFKALYALRDDQPVCMLNLLRFRDLALYEQTEAGTPPGPISGREAYERYSAEAQDVFHRAGGQQLWIGLPQTTLIGPADEPWSLAFVAFYPTTKAFLEMVKSPQYQSATRHRTAALSDSRLIVCSQLQAGRSFSPLSY